MNMKKSIIVSLVMASVMAFGNTLLSGGIGTNEFAKFRYNTGTCFTNMTNVNTINWFRAIGPQVSNYCIVVTNCSRERMLVGVKGNEYREPDCRNWAYITWSLTDYYETETVIKRDMLKYDINGIIGETCIKSEVLSNKRREVKQVISVLTNDWVTVGEDQRWFTLTNIIQLTSMTITNYIQNLIKE